MYVRRLVVFPKLLSLFLFTYRFLSPLSVFFPLLLNCFGARASTKRKKRAWNEFPQRLLPFFLKSLLFAFGFLLIFLFLFFDFIFLSQVEHELQSVHVNQSLRNRCSVASVRSQSLHRSVQKFVHDASR